MQFAINPPNTPLVDARGLITPEWYRFFVQQRAQGDGITESDVITTTDQSAVLPNSKRLRAATDETTLTTGPGTITLGLADTTVVPDDYGDAASTVRIVIDAKGRATAAQAFPLNTSNITEGSNKYYTDARARTALSGGTGISYSSGTGAIALDSGYISTGTYTPTLTNVANLTGSTASPCQWVRVGDMVTVGGLASIQPTTLAVATSLGISLPIASNFGVTTDAGGSGACVSVQQSAGIDADAANDRARLRFIATDTTNRGIFFTFVYKII